MKLTKYEHACFTVEIDGKVLVVDPGNYTKSLVIADNIVAIVVTHEHADHFDPDLLASIYSKNPDSVLVTLPEIADKMPDHPSKKVAPGDTVTIGPFSLEFSGGTHAPIHDKYMQTGDNLGVMINDEIYYPGDSFDLPNRPVSVLALPVGGPWLKLGEVIDFVHAVDAEKIFPTHDFHNSEAGQSMINQIAGGHAQGAEYVNQTFEDELNFDVEEIDSIYETNEEENEDV